MSCLLPRGPVWRAVLLGSLTKEKEVGKYYYHTDIKLSAANYLTQGKSGGFVLFVKQMFP
jgi:hypothetical protein